MKYVIRVRPLAAILVSLPGLLLCLWYSWKTYSSFDEYRRMAGRDVSLDAELFHIELYDVLRGDFRRITMGSPPEPSRIKRFALRISSKDMSALLKSMGEESRPYVTAKIEQGDQLLTAELRLRGQQHWHLLGEQKSLKVKLPQGDLLDGHRVFNLIHDPSPMVVGEQLILDLARSHDIMTPRSEFSRVSLNGADLGVYHYQTQPDESLLRAHRRMPGSMYSGNLPKSAETKDLWRDVKRWAKTGWMKEDNKTNFDDLERFLEHITSASERRFADFARHEMDLERFALFEALDIAFGGDQHDFRQNHKLYFDPYRGKWEPVAWNFRGFKHDPSFNLVENPILLRLKHVPEYVTMRNRILYDLLLGEASVSSLRGRGMGLLKTLVPELTTDRFWAAYKLLPGVSSFYRRMMRPMDLGRAELVFESELTTFSKRRDYLLLQLRHNPLSVERRAERIDRAEVQVVSRVDDSQQAAPQQQEPQQQEPQQQDVHVTQFRILVDGQSGVQIERFKIAVSRGCQQPQWQLLRDGSPLSPPTADTQIKLEHPLLLYPGVGTVKRPDGNKFRGDVRSRMTPASYLFEVRSGCSVTGLEVSGRHLVTGSWITAKPATGELLVRAGELGLRPGEIPRFTDGEIATSPSELEPPRPEVLEIGPGSVTIAETKVYDVHQTVRIAPGTTLLMGPDSSLVFLGKVHFAGTFSAPIVITPSQDVWGGIALQGHATAGSSFEHTTISGGTVPRYRMIPYPGMVNIHDTSDIEISRCQFEANALSDDAIHAVYVDRLLVEDTVVRKPASDGFDLEFTSGSMRNVTVIEPGDDALDLMGSKVSIADSTLLGAKGNGISAGEESEVNVQSTLVAGAKVGVLAKNASSVELSDSLLFRNATGLRTYLKSVRYAGISAVKADVLYIVSSDKNKRQDKDSEGAIQIGHIYERLPQGDRLDHLMENVLGLTTWAELPAWIQSRSAGGTP